MEIFDKINAEAKARLDAMPGSHGWDHTERVLKLALHIGKIEGADLEVLKYAALLHDIARGKEDAAKGQGVCHAEEGGRMAREILSQNGFKKNFSEKVAHCIETHRFRKNNPPKTLEAKILFDADKLDCIGAIGVGRALLFAGEFGARLHDKNVDVEKTQSYSRDDTAYREFLVKLRHVKGKILTEEGKRIAEHRHNFMVDFFNELNDECDGAK